MMELNGTVKNFNPHKGWGFVECNGQDMDDGLRMFAEVVRNCAFVVRL